MSSAISGPTCPVSPSVLLRPQIIRSGFSRRSAKDNARDVASVSEPARARSVTSTARSAPRATQLVNPSLAAGGPMEMTTTSSSGEFFSSTARTSPRRSKGLTSDGTPSRMMVFAS